MILQCNSSGFTLHLTCSDPQHIISIYYSLDLKKPNNVLHTKNTTPNQTFYSGLGRGVAQLTKNSTIITHRINLQSKIISDSTLEYHHPPTTISHKNHTHTQKNFFFTKTTIICTTRYKTKGKKKKNTG